MGLFRKNQVWYMKSIAIELTCLQADHVLRFPDRAPSATSLLQLRNYSLKLLLHTYPYTIRIAAFNYCDIISIKVESPEMNTKIAWKLTLCHRSFFLTRYEPQPVHLCSVDQWLLNSPLMQILINTHSSRLRAPAWLGRSRRLQKMAYFTLITHI